MDWNHVISFLKERPRVWSERMDGFFKFLFLRRLGPIFSKPRLFRFHSIKTEISLIYTVILAVILIMFSGAIYGILAFTLYDEFDNEVRETAREIAGSIRTYLDVRGEYHPNALQYAVEKTIANENTSLRRWWTLGFERSWFRRLDEQDLSRAYVNFVTDQGKSMVHSKTILDPFLKLMMSYANFTNLEKPFYMNFEGQKIRMINHPFEDTEGHRHIIQVGISPKPVVALLENWMNLFLLSIPVLLILTSFVGRLLASRILRPVNKIIKAANSLSRENLSGRVEPEHIYQEMEVLAESFNGMIERMEKSFRHIEEFSSYLAHELKTPLTIMRGETELALMGRRTVSEYEETLKVNFAESERMIRIVEDLLFLSRVDYHSEYLRLEWIEVHEYFTEVYEQARFLGKEKRMNIQLEIPHADEKVFIHGDPLHLRRLFLNLIDNAIKFSPLEGDVRLDVEWDREEVRISVSDSGPGIGQADVDRIFERFYRADNKKPGTGLGLSIVKAITETHGGHIEVESRLGEGSTFSVSFPVHDQIPSVGSNG